VTERIYHVAAAPFEAACRVPILPAGHPSRRPHGHSYIARVRAALPPGWGGFPGAETAALAHALGDRVAALDYSDLNTHLPVPTDENLARWLRDRLTSEVPGIETVGIRSTRHQGADLDGADHCHVWRRFRFEAAHRLPRVPEGHQCGRMHGHGFEVILHADQDLAGQDMGVDFDELEAVWWPLHAELHHACLNDTEVTQKTDKKNLSWSSIQTPQRRYLRITWNRARRCSADRWHASAPDPKL
jgi:6-pyruvoyltetrahydropterin/6-carboxytetrahydropterin synthase